MANGKEIYNQKVAARKAVDRIDVLKDSNWVGRSFLLAGENLEGNEEMVMWRKFSTADVKYVGTGLGQNIVLNSPPAFTPLCDYPRPGVLGANGNKYPNIHNVSPIGMGARYSESIDDNKQIVHLRFGVVKYKGLARFFGSFYDHEASLLARYGRVPWTYYAGMLITGVTLLPITLFAAPLVMADKAWNFMLGRSSSRYMDLKPTMPLFWTRVQVIYNNIGAMLGIIPRTIENTGHYGKGLDKFSDMVPERDEGAYKSFMSKMDPTLFDSKTGLLNVYEVALGGARREYEHRKLVEQIFMGCTDRKQLRKRLMDYINTGGMTDAKKKPTQTSVQYQKSYFDSIMGSMGEGLALEMDAVERKVGETISRLRSDPEALTKLKQETADRSQAAAQQATDPNQPTTPDPSQTASASPSVSISSTQAKEEFMSMTDHKDDPNDPSKTQFSFITGWARHFKENAILEAQDGAAFLNLAVNYTGTVSASWSNSTQETTIQTTLKGISTTARNTRVSLANFNTGFGFVDSAIEAVAGLFGGIADSVSMGGLLALGGNAFVDIPKQWGDSSATFPAAQFTMRLRSPYGSDIARYLNLYLPIATLLAGALPIQAGSQSYTSPNVCECFSKGVCAIRFGMITDLSITAAEGNLGANAERQPLGFDVSFTVADLSSVMYAPINSGYRPLRPTSRVLDDDSAFNDYLQTITAVNLADMVNPKRKLSIRTAARFADYRAMVSPGNVASRIGDVGVVKTVNKLFGPSYFPGV